MFVWFPDGKVLPISKGDGIYYQPCIHPEGTYVVYSGASTGNLRVWRTDLNSNNTIALTPLNSGAQHPVFSWDGEKVAFCSDRMIEQEPVGVEDLMPTGAPPPKHNTNIFIIASDGVNVIQLTKGNFQDQRPTFSPDGKTIAFVSNRSKKLGIWRVDLESKDDPVPIYDKRMAYRPWFSKDGTLLYFFTTIKRRRQICSIPIDGGKITPIARDDKGMSHGPFIDPSGKYLLMHSTRGGNMGLWEISLMDDGKPRALEPPSIRKKATHPTRSKNGIIAFDVVRHKKRLSFRSRELN